MPSIQKRVVSVAEELASIHARLTKVESFPPSAMTLLASYTNNAGVNFSGSTEAIITGLKTPTFTTVRPLPVFIIGTTTIGAQAQEASAQYETRVVVTGQLLGNWSYASWSASTGAATAWNYFPCTSMVSGILPDGTWTAQYNARDLLNVGGNASFTSIYVFAMGG